MKIIFWIFIAFAVIAFLYAMDRIALWMERRGWIYWRRTKKRTGINLGDAFLEIQSMLEPHKKHVLELKKEEKEEGSDSGEPPKAGQA